MQAIEWYHFRCPWVTRAMTRISTASRGFVGDSWAFLYLLAITYWHRAVSESDSDDNLDHTCYRWDRPRPLCTHTGHLIGHRCARLNPAGDIDTLKPTTCININLINIHENKNYCQFLLERTTELFLYLLEKELREFKPSSSMVNRWIFKPKRAPKMIRRWLGLGFLPRKFRNCFMQITALLAIPVYISDVTLWACPIVAL